MEFIDLVINVFQKERKIQKAQPCLQVVPLALIGNAGEEAGNWFSSFIVLQMERNCVPG